MYLKDLDLESPDCKCVCFGVCKLMYFVVCVTKCAYIAQDPLVNEILNLKSF